MVSSRDGIVRPGAGDPVGRLWSPDLVRWLPRRGLQRLPGLPAGQRWARNEATLSPPVRLLPAVARHGPGCRMVVADPEDPWSVFFGAPSGCTATPTTMSAGTWVPEDWAGRVLPISTDGEYISALAFSPIDPNRACTWRPTAARIFVSDDQGHAPGPRPSNTDALRPHYFYGHALVASHEDRRRRLPRRQWLPVARRFCAPPTAGRSWDGARSTGCRQTQVYGAGRGRRRERHDCSPPPTRPPTSRLPEGGPWVDITDSLDAPVTTYWSVEWLEEGAARFGTYGSGASGTTISIRIGDGCWEGRDAGSGWALTAMSGLRRRRSR